MRITQKGQVTIPEGIRDKYGFLPHMNVDFIEEGGRVYLAVGSEKQRGNSIVAHLRGTANIRMSTDEILKLTRGSK